MATDKSKSSTETKQVFDVAAPGKTPADATSRPVIIKGRSLMKDPMMAVAPSEDQPETQPDTAEETQIPSEAKKTITPPTEDEPKAEVDADPVEPEAKNKDKDNQAQQPATDASSMSSAAVDALADVAVKAKKSKKEDPKIREALNEHIEQKTYFVPIAQLTKRRLRIELFISLFVLCVVVALYLAIDAELLLPGVSLPFEFL